MHHTVTAPTYLAGQLQATQDQFHYCNVLMIFVITKWGGSKAILMEELIFPAGKWPLRIACPASSVTLHFMCVLGLTAPLWQEMCGQRLWTAGKVDGGLRGTREDMDMLFCFCSCCCGKYAVPSVGDDCVFVHTKKYDFDYSTMSTELYNYLQYFSQEM